MFDFLREVLDELKDLSGSKRPIIPDEKFFLNFLPVLKKFPSQLIIVLPEVHYVLNSLKGADKESFSGDQAKVAKNVAKGAKEALQFIQSAGIVIQPEFDPEYLEEIQQKNAHEARLFTQFSMIENYKPAEEKPIFVTHDEKMRNIAMTFGFDTYLYTKDGTQYVPSSSEANVKVDPKRKPEGKTKASNISRKKKEHPKTLILEDGKTGLANRKKTKRPKDKSIDISQIADMGKKLIKPTIIGFLVIAFAFYVLDIARSEAKHKDHFGDLQLPIENMDVELVDVVDTDDGFRLEYEVVNRNEETLFFGYLDRYIPSEEHEKRMAEINKNRAEGMKLKDGQLIIVYKNETIERLKMRRELPINEIETIIISGDQPLDEVISITGFIQNKETGVVKEWIFKPKS